MRPTHVALVWWMDAHKTEGPQDEQDVECWPYRKLTTGLLIEENEKGVVVAHELNEDGTYESTTFIPRGMLRRMLRYKIVYQENGDQWAGRRKRYARPAAKLRAGSRAGLSEYLAQLLRPFLP